MEATEPGVSLRIVVAWGDMDALGHVNNTVYLRWFESARIAWWERIAPAVGASEPLAADLGPSAHSIGPIGPSAHSIGSIGPSAHSIGPIGPILARTTIDYRRPVRYPDTVEVRVTARRIGGKSVTLGYEVTSSAQDGAVVAEGETVIVMYDYRRGTPVPIDDTVREAMQRGGG
ncbi:MAG: thioesterase family protein [Polyangia bacterium]